MNAENESLDTQKKLAFNQEGVSFWGMISLVFLLPLFFIPSLAVPILISKNILLVIALTFISIIFLVGSIKRGNISFPKHNILWSIIVFPIIYLLASLSSISKDLSLFGYNLEVGTFASIVIFFLLFGLTTLIFNDRQKIFKLQGALFASFLLVALFSLVKLFSEGKLLVFNNFSGSLGNPIGNWTDYSIYFGLFILLITLALQNLSIKRPMRIFLYAGFVVSLFMLAVINFTLAWALTLIGALLILGVTVGKQILNLNKSDVVINYFNYKYSIALVIISLLFVLNPTISSTTGTIGNSISSIFNIQNTEVRPSLEATLEVTKPVLKTDPIFGSGPNTFSREWLINKPNVINQTVFWNVAFPFGIGFLPTQIASVGLVGSLFWMLFLILLGILGFKALIKNSSPILADRYLLASTFVGALFLWIAAIIYVPSLVVLALAFIFTGLFISTCAVTGIIGSKTITFGSSPRKNLLSVVTILLILMGVVTFGFKVFQKTISSLYFQSALVAANTGSQTPEFIKEKINKAISFSAEDLYFRALSTLSFNQAQLIVNKEDAATTENVQAFRDAYSESLSNAQKAIDTNPENYENWISLGSLYEALVPAPFAVEGAYENAKAAYEAGRLRNPKSPEIPLILGRLDLAKNNIEGARTNINQAIALKNDYAAAYFLLARLEIGANNIATAIKAAESGAILSPGNAGVFFELGLLKYSNKDFLGGAQAFAEAIRIVPDYANAQYFLGLSLYELKMNDDALAQFRALLRTNPDNAEVKLIIGNLEAGRAPFFPANNKNVGPAATTNPPLESAPTR